MRMAVLVWMLHTTLSMLMLSHHVPGVGKSHFGAELRCVLRSQSHTKLRLFAVVA